MSQQDEGLEGKLNMAKSWKIEGGFNEVVSSYASINSKVSPEVLERRKKLFANLNESLMVPDQKYQLDYARENAEDLMIFESGGTFGFFVNNFLDIIYADAVSAELREKGKKSLNFIIIDPTDVSRFERTIQYAGKKVKMPLPEESAESWRSTQSIASPTKLDLTSFFDTVEKETEIYFEEIWRLNHGFKREVELGKNLIEAREKSKLNLAKLKERTYGFAEQSKSYREFTDKLLIELISPLIRNSIFVTLNQWQSAWNIAEQFKDSKIYGDIDRVTAKITANEEESKRPKPLKRETGNYSFPFRIDNKEAIFHSPVANLKDGKVYMNEKEIGAPGSLNSPIADLFTPNFNLIPQGGILYALDALAYDAIPLVPSESRVIVGHELASEKTKTKPFLAQYEIPFFSLARRTKSSPDTKKSGAISAYLEGLDADFVKKTFAKRDKIEFSVASDIYTKYGQPLY